MAALSVRHAALINAMGVARREHIASVENGYADLAGKVAHAFAAHELGDEKRARVLLNEALDLECDLTGDCALLNDLSEEWGVDYDEDR